MKVLLSGYYGFGNLGDEALLSGLVGALRARGHEPCVLSQEPQQTAQLHGVAAAQRLRGAPAALWRHDALISGGGGLLQDKTSRRSLQYYLGLIRLARALGKTVIVYGQSIGPLSEAGRRVVARSLAGVPTAVRDEASQALLASLGIQAELVADAALLLEPSPITARGGCGEGPVLLIPRGGYPQISSALSKLAALLRERGVPVAALACHPGQDDAPVAAIKGAVPELAVWRADTPSAALAALTRARHVVSARLHGLILAAVNQIPMSGIVYDPKVAAFLVELELPQHRLPIDAESLADEVLAARNLERIWTRAQQLRARAHRGLDWLERHLQA